MLSIVSILRSLGASDLPADTDYPYQISCLFHDGDERPSMRVYPETNSCYCWKCHKSWNPISAYAEAHEISYFAAKQALGLSYGKGGEEARRASSVRELEDYLLLALQSNPRPSQVWEWISKSARGVDAYSLIEEVKAGLGYESITR